MPKSLTQYRVFIGSPGGLEDERKGFRRALEDFTTHHGEPRGVTFHPVGWEDTLSGVGRPQALINQDLEQCDYAVFVLHDRWGTPTGPDHTSGTEEEFAVAERLYEAAKIRNIVLFFKEVGPAQLRDPGPQLRSVLAFKTRIQDGRKYLFKAYAGADELDRELQGQLSKWLRDHEGTGTGASLGGLPTLIGPGTSASASPEPSPPLPPGFDYWIAEADRLMQAEIQDFAGALFCAEKAVDAAVFNREWVKATNTLGIAQARSNKLEEAIASFSAIAERHSVPGDAVSPGWVALALVNKGVALGQLDRGEAEIAVYDDVIARFGATPEPALREPVAKALFNKGVALGQLGRSEAAIAAYDEVIARFGAAPEPALRAFATMAEKAKASRLAGSAKPSKT